MKKNITFLFPREGDCLNCQDGKVENQNLIAPIKVSALAGSKIVINGVLALYCDGVFVADIPIPYGESILKAYDESDMNNCCFITVYRLKGAEKGYRLSVDDNIRIFEELTTGDFSSIWEHPYLALFKEAHELFGAVAQWNVFLDSYGTAGFSKPINFELSQMTNRFQKEWEECSDWFKLSFHGRREYPVSYYQDLPENLEQDYLKTRHEIERFACKNSLSVGTTVHCGEVGKGGIQTLRKLGCRFLSGCFEWSEQQNRAIVGYGFSKDLCERFSGRDFLFWEGMLFSRINRILNFSSKADENIAELNNIFLQERKPEFLELMIHEQYFYPDYAIYLPEYRKIVLESCRWAIEHGYMGKTIDSIL